MAIDLKSDAVGYPECVFICSSTDVSWTQGDARTRDIVSTPDKIPDKEARQGLGTVKQYLYGTEPTDNGFCRTHKGS